MRTVFGETAKWLERVQERLHALNDEILNGAPPGNVLTARPVEGTFPIVLRFSEAPVVVCGEPIWRQQEMPPQQERSRAN